MIDFATRSAPRPASDPAWPDLGSRSDVRPGPNGPPSPAAPAPSSATGVRARREKLGRLGDEIARLSAHLQAATYRLLAMIRAFDEEEGWHEEGFRNCAGWLSWRTGITPGAAREKVRVARALGRLPRLSDALRRGELSYSAARALTRVAAPENEAELAEVARHTPAAQLERLVAGWRAADRAEERERERARHQRRALWVVPEADGSWAIRGRLDPEAGAVLCRALEAAAEALYAGDATEPESPPEARRADALGLVAEAALGGGLGAPRAEAGGEAGPEAGTESGMKPARPAPAPVVGRAERFQVVVHVSAETLAGTAVGAVDDAAGGGDRAAGGMGGTADQEERAADRAAGPPEAPRIERGPHVSAETSRRLACDAGLVMMTHDRLGKVLDVGRKTRTVPPALRRALERRDGGCRFPGCTARYCDAHHLRHWAAGGHTKLENLALLCRRHHRLLHEGGWRVERDRDGELRFYRPDGRRLPEVPEVPPIARAGEDPVDALVREQRALQIDPWTPTPTWLGEPLDLEWALFTLRRPSGAEASGDGASGAEASGAEAPGASGTDPAGPGVSAETPATVPA